MSTDIIFNDIPIMTAICGQVSTFAELCEVMSFIEKKKTLNIWFFIYLIIYLTNKLLLVITRKLMQQMIRK